MIKVSKKVEYGLTALLHLDSVKEGEKVSTNELSDIYSIPEQHLGKVLQKMAKEGVISSIKGKHGGYMLAVGLGEISLGRIIEVLDGPMIPVHEGEQHELCVQFCTCYAKGVMHEIQEYVRKAVYDVSLAELLGRGEIPHTGVA
jgi:Rrf2 family protein